ncbi:helix-hairpin-helix domain-containing protein [Catellatospora sp. KI3]|uniref:helix-hairpin-helix domain-containing protein n=1 Tax=Catellatospora sp. KI3 TaxID=3041620 RepID=UPI00248309F1|nr:helix-hairpin-helix domain-containing protein [Catellatospora sp. KI3]MDI1464438.1 helix-hairpin-helix domain-containing protein [Catellatospora sp. KI3]
MAWFIGQSLLIIIAAFILGLLVGYLLWARRKPESIEEVVDEEMVDTITLSRIREDVVAMESAKADAAQAAAEQPVVAAAEPAAEPDEIEVQQRPVTKVAPIVKAAVPKQVEPDDAADADIPVAAAVAVAVDDTPADDIERIEGIGPKMKAALNTAGIRTYAQLAAADETTLRTAIENAGMKFAPSIVTWAAQAQLLADGDEAGFEDLARRLVAGRDTGRA